MVHTAALVISEFVTNTVRYAGSGHISMTVQLTKAALEVDVRHPNPALPQPGLHNEHSENGRGLFLVAALADRYAAEPTPTDKRCWTEIARATGPGRRISPSLAEEPIVTTSLSASKRSVEMIAVRPGPPLADTVTVDGSNNAASPLLAAAAALGSPVQLNNIPGNTDVQIMLALEAEPYAFMCLCLRCGAGYFRKPSKVTAWPESEDSATTAL